MRSLNDESRKQDEDYMEAAADFRDHDPFDGQWVAFNEAVEMEKIEVPGCGVEFAG